MKKNLMICIECPAGCPLEIDTESGKVLSVKGHKCPKGEKYAVQEIEAPKRMITTTVLTTLSVKYLPVKTSAPVEKGRVFEFIKEIAGIKVSRPVKAGETVAGNLLNSGINLIACRTLK